MTTRDDAVALDSADPLNRFRDEFFVGEPDLLYFDGNSLGRLPLRTQTALADAVTDRWGTQLIRQWDDGVSLPVTVGDRLGQLLLGAAPGETALSDSTSVNFYKLAAAALAARPGRSKVITDDQNFPTDHYIVEGLAQDLGRSVTMLNVDPVDGVTLADLKPHLDDDVALVTFSHVAYKSAAIADMAAITSAAHEVGALVLWDLSHTVGSVPVDLRAAGVDLAVGCTYKYLNAGPGSPAFVYVRKELHTELRQPIWGWYGQRDMFAMAQVHDPIPGIERFTVGTPPILSVIAVEHGLALIEEAGFSALRTKSIELTEFLIRLCDERLAPYGFSVASPRDSATRGSHVALRHPDAGMFNERLRSEMDVLGDFREPDNLRLGLAPLYTGFTDVFDVVTRIERLATSGEGTLRPAL